MGEIPRVGDLEVGQDLDFLRRAWVLQRVGWGVLALLVLAAVLGLVGPGPLCRAVEADSAGLLRLEYERFEHLETNATLRLHLAPGVAQEGKVRLALSQDYLRGVELE